ncbi:hypothetical protein JXA88_10155 [Candidatus Fermentibacteria bacterium]|nr:hypothetical protein [Candidatus Fermentibacteria bacterium]
MCTRCLVLVLVLLLALSIASAEIPTVISYQGKVTDAGGTPVPDNTYTMRFRIYDDVTGGSVLWDSGAHSVSVTGGVFSVLLGESPQPAITLDFSQNCWLLVTFNGVNQTPRQRLASAGYAYMASGLVPGTEIVGDCGSPVLNAVNTNPDGIGLRGEIAAPAGAAVVGHATDLAGVAIGVLGESNSQGGTGVFGWANADSDSTVGVAGRSDAANGRGVSGWATTGSGANVGVHGVSDSNAGTGVLGETRSTAGITAGVYGRTASPVGYGVYGEATATSLTAKGVYARTGAPFGAGVYSEAMAATGNCTGVYGGSASNAGTGIWGEATASAGVTYGVYGKSRSTAGCGVYGEASSSTGSIYGLYGRCSSPSGCAVFGENTATASGGCGIAGVASSTSGIGVSGTAAATTGSAYGGSFVSHSVDGTAVYGIADMHGVGQSFGGWFQSSSNAGRGVHGVAAHPTGYTYGVYGMTLSTHGYGVYYSGGLAGTGTKSCVVKTSKGPTLMYCQESPENWFEDFGEARLVNGRCRVELDPLFQETVTIDEANPLHVFVELHDECEGVYVKRGLSGFEVVELRRGTSHVSFSYRVVAKRKGFEDNRLDYCKAAETDSHLYPELREKGKREAFGVRSDAEGT